MAQEKFRFVCATRYSSEDFFAKTLLGRSLALYRRLLRGRPVELELFPQNTAGLPSVYNHAIEKCKADPSILIFAHDDLTFCDFYWPQRLLQAFSRFEIVGLVGNTHRTPGQVSWMFLDEQLRRDDHEHFSGVIGHGENFPTLKELSVYGNPGQEVKLLDGVMMAVRSETLVAHNLRFDPQFKFHFYDLDFCRQAELRNLKMGTWALSAVHGSSGRFGGEDWRNMLRLYRMKYNERSPLLPAAAPQVST